MRTASAPLTIEDVELDEPLAHEVLIRTVATGVCHSDLHVIDGHLPLTVSEVAGVVLGHEGAGVVEAVGDAVTYVRPGDHVVACLSTFCGTCDECLAGHSNLCRWENPIATRPASEPPRISQNGQPLHQFMDLGSFAESMLVHENSLVKVAPDVPLVHACLLSCGVLTGVGAALRTARVAPASTVAVFGCGGVGLSVVQGAEIAGAKQIIGIDIFASKLELASELGATHGVNAREVDPVAAIRDLTLGRGVDYAFDAMGSVELTRQAVDSLANRGTATIVGSMSPGDTLELRANALSFEKRLQNSHMGSNRFRVDIPRYLELYKLGKLRLDLLVTHTLPLDAVNEAFHMMKFGTAARTVLVFG